MLHKIRKAMSEREAGYMLTKIIEMDDAYFGAPDEGGKRSRWKKIKTLKFISTPK
jgi:hypothetical protein